MSKRYLIKNLKNGKEFTLVLNFYRAVRYLADKNYCIKLLEEDTEDITPPIEDKKEEEKEEMFKCDICDREFTTQRGLNSHMRVHSGGDE